MEKYCKITFYDIKKDYKNFELIIKRQKCASKEMIETFNVYGAIRFITLYNFD